MPRSFALSQVLKARLSLHLCAHVRREIAVGDQRPAAVALTLLPDAAGDACFLLTRRAGELQHHGGQFALPGGRCEPGEDAVTAARRELFEELGVPPERVEALGSLDDFATRSGFVITPVVFWAPDVSHLAPDPREVAIVYRVPIRQLYGSHTPVLEASPDSAQPLLSLPLLGTHIHSPTAAIIFQMREVAFEGRETRAHHFAEPRFAWK